jgi:rhamnulokinase
LEKATGKAIKGLHIVGGGSQNRLLNQLTANVTKLPVQAGPVEATAIGNLSIQAIADGRFKNIQEARSFLREHQKSECFFPAS